MNPQSPVQSSFSFGFEDDNTQQPVQPPSSPSPRKDITQPITYGAPGERREASEEQESSRKQVNKRRTQFFDDQFQERNTTGSARERVTRDSPVIAELRTNCIVMSSAFRARKHLLTWLDRKRARCHD